MSARFLDSDMNSLELSDLAWINQHGCTDISKLPRRIQENSKRKRVPDIFSSEEFIFVSNNLKRLIGQFCSSEEVEFAPIELVSFDGGESIAFNILIPRNTFKIVDWAQTDHKVVETPRGEFCYISLLRPFYLDAKSKSSSRHLFFEPALISSTFFISRKLKDRIIDERIRGIDFIKGEGED